MILTKKIILVEDDEDQATAIKDNVSTGCRYALLECEFLKTLTTEQEAINFVTTDEADDVDLFIVDLMLPWTHKFPIDEPSDPRVRNEGALRAGFRVIETIRNRERVRGLDTRPIILYTVSTFLGSGSGHQEAYSYERLQKTDDQEAELTDWIVQSLISKH